LSSNGLIEEEIRVRDFREAFLGMGSDRREKRL
jgi:hypothetical protein